MKKVLILIPLLFLMMVGSAFAATKEPTPAAIAQFYLDHPSTNSKIFKITINDMTTTEVRIYYLATKKGDVLDYYNAGGNFGSVYLKTTLGTGYYLLKCEDSTVSHTANSTNYNSIFGYVGAIAVDQMGEKWNLEGVGLEEIPGQMVGVGGIALPAALTILGALLMVGLVRRFPHWFLR